MNEGLDERPLIFAVDPDPRAIQRITGELQRYSADYRVICGPSPEAALTQLERLREEGARVAIVLAARGNEGLRGEELLALPGGHSCACLWVVCVMKRRFAVIGAPTLGLFPAVWFGPCVMPVQ